ncbi:MAG: peptide deformylase [Alphaproteobacteria bacterium]|jgi:peptide deformylase|nr:peptide deformylase [Alphaproteobacteria bacterium]
MALRDILIAPHAKLKTKAAPVEAVDDELRRLMDDMLETMYAAPGIGLAAPQVGVMQRLIVLDVAGKDGPPAPMCLVNPEIVARGEDTVVAEEGCLSLPEIYAEVERHARVFVRFTDREGEVREMDTDGLLARCVQHELDHLDGVLFVDHLSALKRKMLLRKLAKLQREKERQTA